MDPEYSFDEYFQLGSRRNIRPIKNGLNCVPERELERGRYSSNRERSVVCNLNCLTVIPVGAFVSCLLPSIRLRVPTRSAGRVYVDFSEW